MTFLFFSTHLDGLGISETCELMERNFYQAPCQVSACDDFQSTGASRLL